VFARRQRVSSSDAVLVLLLEGVRVADAKEELAEKDKETARLKALYRRVTDDTVELYGYRYRKRQDGKGPAAGNPFCDVCLQNKAS
jgi:hypothetical protein